MRIAEPQTDRPTHAGGILRIAALALLTAVLLQLSTFFPALAQPDETKPPDRPVAVEARITSIGEATRLSFSLSKPVTANAFVMERPDRVVVDLPEVNFQMPAQAGRKGGGLIAGFRYGLFAPGRSRIVIDLTHPARVTGVRSQETAAGIAALVVDLERSERPAFSKLAEEAAARNRASAPEGAAQPSEKPAAADQRPVVVIDPGHGGVDPGAVTPKIAEKAIVLSFGLKLKSLLEAEGRYRVVMTREDDRFLPLSERVQIARQNAADLFISIHADSLSAAQDVRGATVYTGSERATDAESARLAARENQVDALAGVDIPAQAREEVADILLDLAKRETRAFSAVVAASLVRSFDGVIKLHKIPQRSAGFRVLTAPDVPSVLIELGYVSSAKDVEQLISEDWQGKAAGAAQRAVGAFFTAKNGAKGSGAAMGATTIRP